MESERTNLIVRFYRLVRLALHIVYGVVVAATIFPLVTAERKRQIIGYWSALLLRILNIQLKLSGTRPCSNGRANMVVANHVSWLDIFAINSVCPMRFIAKSEIRSWPVVGWLCAQAGTLFMVRGKARELRRVNEIISQRLVSGDLIAVFPEGMTTFGDTLGRFHASLLQPAISVRARFWPIAIRFYKPDGGNNREAAYVGDTSLLESVWSIVGEKVIYAELIFCEAIDSVETTRQALARKLEQVIALALNLPAPGTAPEKSPDLRREPRLDDSPTSIPYLKQEDLVQPVDQALTNARK
jgi:1-acyl-sn-glycerol-3-phosphate acyltransferase